ncbi:unnamed protein product [Echinostoma caproni]|uniref:MRP-S28 domain-containing protein n=1 Tax=Echinostoma caproni TaxID=27848 RepID=A0A183AU74_9TREM|nr:unnamed protein product [Echinostoma caproni]
MFCLNYPKAGGGCEEVRNDMRLTAFLCRGKRIHRDKLEYLRKQFWRHTVSKMEVDRLRVPDRVLRSSQAPFRQAEDMFTSTRYEDVLAQEIELGVNPEDAARIAQDRSARSELWSPFRNDFRYHSGNQEPTLMFSGRRRLTKGLDQAGLLTNTAIVEGPPPVMKNVRDNLDSLILSNRADMSEQDSEWRMVLRNAVERAILHAHVWHTDETKLPRRFCPELPIWHHKTEYGIHPQLATRFLFHNLFRLLNTQVSTDLGFSVLVCRNRLEYCLLLT